MINYPNRLQSFTRLLPAVLFTALLCTGLPAAGLAGAATDGVPSGH